MRAEEFFDRVPELFARSRPRWEAGYDGLIYAIRRPLSMANVHDVVAWTDGGKLPDFTAKDLVVVNDVLLPLRWPDVRPLNRLKVIEGMTLTRATALLHFHNPSFPPFTAGAVQGLALLGKRVRRPSGLKLDDVRAYRRYLDVMSALKERWPYQTVPETHYFHAWLLEASLGELARGGKGDDPTTRGASI